MKLLYVISPEYLLPFEEQSKNYTFNVMGFRLFRKDKDQPEIADAKSELYKINVNDLEGFVILIDNLSYYIEDVNEFLQEADRVCKNHRRRAVIVTLDNKGDKYYQYINRLENIDLFRVSNINILTDHIINQEIFGTIIKGKAPYKFMLNEDASKDYKDIPLLRYRPIISRRVLSVLDDVLITGRDFRHVLQSDFIYRGFLDEEDQVLAFLRKVKIAKVMQYVISNEEYERFFKLIEGDKNSLLYRGLLKECGGKYE